MHNYTGWRDALDPHLTRPPRQDVGVRPRRAVLARHRRRRRRRRVRPLRPPGARVPGRGRRRLGPREPGHGRRGGRAARRRPGEALLRRRVRRGVVVARWLPLEERARRHERYESWIARPGGPVHPRRLRRPQEILATGCSMGAFHAANFALRRADLFPLAICLSGQLRPAGRWGERGDAPTSTTRWTTSPAVRRPPRLAALARQPPARVRPGHVGGHDRRAREHERLAGLLGEKGIPHELDLWGHDVPHDWPSWRAQIAHHLPRFC